MAGQNQTSYVPDGETGFLGGQDASKSPDQVRPGFLYAAVNATFKFGVLGPRDPFFKHSLVYPEGGVSIGGKIPTSYKQIFESGKFQAIIPYSIGTVPFQIIVVSGIIFLLNQETLELQVLTPLSGPNLNQYADRLNWSLAAKYVVIFDYPLYPMIIQDFTAQRSSDFTYGVPISTKGSYNQTRLIIANAGNEFTAGDPTGSLLTPDAPITFEEVLAPAAPYKQQAFQLPTAWQNNPITALGFLQLVDTSTGIGPLIVATNSQISAFQTQLPRTSWDETNTFGQIIVDSAGIAGQRAQVNVNSDLFFASDDGQIRSLSMSRSEQGKWSKVPLSREVQNWLLVQSPDLTQFYALAYFNNKIFCTANPYRVVARDIEGNPVWDYAFGGMVVMELDNVSNLNSDSPPVWAGLWTGIRPMDFSYNDRRLFVMAKEGGINTLWEVRPDLNTDTADEKKRLIKSIFYTRSYDFGDPYVPKNILLGNFPFSNVKGEFSFNAKYKPSHASNFLNWRDFKHNAPYELCSVPWQCPNGLAAQNFRNIKFGAVSEDGCDPVSTQQYSYFNEVQFRFEIKGVSWELPKFKVKVKNLPESDNATTCTNYNTVGLCLNCNEDWEVDPFEEC